MKSIEETISKAKCILSNVQARRQNSTYYADEPIADNTILEYEKVFKRLEKIATRQAGLNFNGCLYDPEKFIEIAKNVRTRSTWFKRKAAITKCIQDRIQNQIASVSEITDEKCLERDIKIIELLEQSAPEEIFNNKLIKTKKAGLNSKRNLLRHLPSNWQENLFEMTNFVNGVEEQLLTLSLTGCRPVELKNEIIWELNELGLTAKINGAKRKKFSGQKYRILTFSTESPLHNRMAEIVAEAGGLLSVRIDNAKKFSAYISEIGNSYFPELKSKLTAYTFRHQFAANIKATLNSKNTNLTLEDLAGALGHSTTEMQRLYGHVTQSKGSDVGLKKVEVERTVKKKIKDSYKAIKNRSAKLS